MAQTLFCPKCGRRGITVNVSQFYNIKFSTSSNGDYPLRVACSECRQLIRYKTEKKATYSAKNTLTEV